MLSPSQIASLLLPQAIILNQVTTLRQALNLWQTMLSLNQIVMPPSQALPRPVFPRWLAALAPRKQRSPLPSRQNNYKVSSSMEEPNPKWVINLSSKPLTKAQRSVLVKGPNFVVSPKHPTNSEYITTIESACTKLSQQDAEELRTDINQVLRVSHPQAQPNQSSKHSSKGT